MKRIYVAGPFSAPTPEGVQANVKVAIWHGEQIDQLGANAFVPHLYKLWDEHFPAHYERWMAKCFAELDRSDALFLIDFSPGANRERERALAQRKPVLVSLEEVITYLHAPKAEVWP